MAKRKPQSTRSTRATGDLFSRAGALARNMWWTWDHAAQQFFAALDPVLWEAVRHAPLDLLAQLGEDRKSAILADASFEKALAKCEAALKKYLATRPWYDKTIKRQAKRMRIAYFCAEFGLHESFPQYSGGLGVLAGDHLKSASDLGVPLCAVGLLYRNGYYQQQLDASGAHVPLYPDYDFERFPVIDTKLKVRVPMGKRNVVAKIWRLDVGRVPAYLLDTDVPDNRPADRKITQRLYGGDNETRIQQEIILGVGGVLALEKLGEKVTVFHLNEGHAAFCALQRTAQIMKGRSGLTAAMNKVSRSTVFTTHTPVPAGHDRFDPKLTMKYIGHYADKLGLSREDFLALGREDPENKKEPFCMTVLALNLSDHRNGVAKLHGEVSREMWQHVHDVERVDDVPIGYVTNGVHSQTWLAPEMDTLYSKYLKPKWVGAKPEDDWWQAAKKIPAEALWQTRSLLRRKLVHFIRQRLIEQIQRKLGPAEELAAAHAMFDPEALTIGFARRFATYKRAPLIFKDAKRLSKILSSADKPVQLVFAGKAHPADKDGQKFAQQIYKFARTNGLTGRVVLLENYDFTIGRMMTSGCDVWLNNPLRPREASGTSGMKPPLHGGLNCSILDGWWPEGFNGKNGWAIGDGSEMKSQSAQDKYDANRIYELLEKEIVPLYYKRGRDGVPRGWVKMMQESMASVCGMFNTNRMVGEYVENYYLPANG
jgi:starch phosphorylase